MKKQWLLFGVLATILASSCQVGEKAALADVAQRLNIEPTLEALMDYVWSALPIGMPYEDVQSELERIGSVTFVRVQSFPDRYRACEYASFRFGRGVGLEYLLCYNEQMRLDHKEVVTR